MKTLGITGTREGATPQQIKVLHRIMKWARNNGYTDFVHGDCIGVDIAAAELALDYGFHIHTRPSTARTRAWFEGPHTLYDPLPPLVRDKLIVAQADSMVACPKQMQEQFRGSGTWATIRYTKKAGKNLLIAYPEGQTERFWS